jgi:hypothetical protein
MNMKLRVGFWSANKTPGGDNLIRIFTERDIDYIIESHCRLYKKTHGFELSQEVMVNYL